MPIPYKRTWVPQAGFTPVVTPGDAGLRRIRFGVLRLRQGESFTLDARDQETALVVLSGAASLEGPGFSFAEVGRRRSVFAGRAAALYLPAALACAVQARTDVEIAVCQAPSEREGTARLICPEQVKEVVLGKNNWQRLAYMIVDESVPAHLLFIGEALVPPGNWASFPPHRHEKDDLPEEVEMEEMYFFRFDPPQGYGIQKIYTADRSTDETLTVEENDTVLIPRGYHPVVAAPGYSMYYLWVMAGTNRRFLSRQDPRHRWVAQS